MDDVTLFVVVLTVDDAPRRRRLRAVMATFGEAVGRDVFEVPATPRAMQRIQAALEPDLASHDEVRIYPVCARCRDRALAHGTHGFASTPVAWVF